MFGFFKKKKKKQEVEEKYFFVNVEIPTVLSPIDDRADAEDIIEGFLSESGLGMVDGGGTFMSDDGQPVSCQITILLNELNIKHFAQLAEFIKDNVALPKGSKLVAERDNYYSDEELKDFEDIELN
ncbi:MAG: hypothetical protein FWE13_04160 [Firmicutes bacterium]|nr:hypothetical protein [Bacillota bacterium]